MKKIWALLLALVLLLSVFGVSHAEEEPVNGVVRRYFWSDPTETELAQIAYAEEKYGIKVEYDVVAWDSLDVRTLTDMNGGDAPDLVVMHIQNFPRVAVQKIIKPVDELNQELVNNPLLVKNSASARSNYTFGGKTYAVAGGANPRYIFFNKTMFEDYGLETPLELYEAGNWNWDTFRQCALDVMDSDEDGNVTVWGYDSWVYDMWVLANGGNFMKYNDDGTMELNFNDEKTIRALQFMQDSYFKDKFMKPDGNITYTGDFVSGKCAMMADGLYRAADILAGGMKDEWDFVPVPAGPDNAEGVIPGNCDALGICTGAKNPDGALMYLIAVEEYNEEHKDDAPKGYMAELSEEQIALNKDICENSKIVINNYEGIGNIKNLQWDYWSQIFNGTPVVTANESYAPAFQAEVDVTLADITPKVKKAFDGLPVIDFEDETADFMTNVDGNGGSWGDKAFEIVEDGIDGKSLLITADESSEWQLAARTDPDKWFFPSYGHVYKISFDYKMISDMRENGYFYVTVRPAGNIGDGAVSFGWCTSANMKAGEAGTFECTIGIDQETAPLCVVIGGFNNGSVMVDNLTIVDAD